MPLTGYLTDVLDWRWIFYINLSVGLISLPLARKVPDTPRRERRVDRAGPLLLSLCIGIRGIFSRQKPLFDLQIFRDGNFAASSFVITALGLAMYGAMVNQPTLSTLSSALTAEAAGLFSLLRTIGSSAGIDVITTFYTRDTQAVWSHPVGTST